MNVWACCTLAAAASVEKATGVRPITSPPLSSRAFDPAILSGHDLIYFRLHIIPNLPYVWFGEGENGLTGALRVDQLAAAQLDGAVVVVANCYGADNPGVKALYQAGASAVISGPGPNYAAGNAIVGADLLVKVIIAGMRMRLNVKQALALAKTRLLATSFRATDRDTLAFTIIKRGDV